MFLITLILFVLVIIVYLYWSYRSLFLFFEKRNIAYLKPSVIVGNIIEVVLKKKALFEVYANIYRELEPHSIGGFFKFHNPVFIICHPELIRYVLLKDSVHFLDREPSKKTRDSLGTDVLFRMNGEKWKNLRVKLTPSFSSGKLKMMFPLIKVCGDNLVRVLERLSSEEEIEFKGLCARYTTDVTATCAFGIETNTLENPNSELFQLSRLISEGSLLGFIMLHSMPKISSTLARIFKFCINNKKIKKCYESLILKTIEHREKNKIVRYDFLHLLIGLKHNSDMNKFQDEHDAKDLKKFLSEIREEHTKDVEMTDKILVDQVFFFVMAGLDSMSNALSSALLELARNPHIQDKVREEITTILINYDGQLTYEAIKEMNYTDMVISETLRKYPSSAVLFRKCSSDYVIPGTKSFLKKDDNLVIPIYGLHMDKKYYEKPNEFYPEHFTAEAIAGRPHCSYLPFGEGPRMCIASRFAKMILKVGLVYSCKNCAFSVSPKTEFPIQHKPRPNHFLEVKGGVWLKCRTL